MEQLVDGSRRGGWKVATPKKEGRERKEWTCLFWLLFPLCHFPRSQVHTLRVASQIAMATTKFSAFGHIIIMALEKASLQVVRVWLMGPMNCRMVTTMKIPAKTGRMSYDHFVDVAAYLF